jgi:hypothetical protein
MMNLAGKQCDQYIRHELDRALIPVVTGARSVGEVASCLTGELHGFTFIRAWRYYIVTGDVPLWLAQSLYDDPLGRSDVRVAGHCDRRPPREFASYFDTDDYRLDVPSPNEQATLEVWRASRLPVHRRLLAEFEASCRSAANPPAVAAWAAVTHYHVDSVAGLRLFADAIRRHEIHSAHVSREERVRQRVEAAVHAVERDLAKDQPS